MIDSQLKNNDCGVSAVKTVFNLFHQDISRKYIQQHIFLDEKGSRLTDLQTFFEQHDFSADLRVLDVHHLQQHPAAIREHLPFILPVRHAEGLHYVVVDQCKGQRLRVLDPAKAQSYYVTVPELKQLAHFSKSYWDLLHMEQKLTLLCNQELTTYDVKLEQALATNDASTLFNKLTYFGYIKEQFGLKSPAAEKAFLEDLLFRQQLGALPKHFRSLTPDKDRIRLRAAMVLAVQPKPAPSGRAETPRSEANPYLALLRDLGRSRRIWYIYIFAALFSALTAQLAVFINQVLIDYVLPSYQLNLLVVFAVGVGVFKLFDVATSLNMSFVGIHMGNLLDKYFLTRFDEKLNSYSIQYVQSFKRGDLTERLSDAFKLKGFFLRFFTKIIVDVSVSLYSLGILFYLNWKLTLVVCGVMAAFVVWFRLITPPLKQNERLRFRRKSDYFSKMIEKLDGIQVLKAFRLEETHSRALGRIVDQLLSVQLKNKYLDLVNVAVVSVITLAASLLILVALSKQAIDTNAISLGQIITYVALSERVFAALRGLLAENLVLQENEVVLRRYLDFDERPTSESAAAPAGIADFTIRQLRLEGLSFGYTPHEAVLRDVCLHARAGDKIRIEGRNGSGKSTLSKVLAGLYRPTGGALLLNDTHAHFYDAERVREKVVLVTNEDLLFNDSLEFNIALGRPISTGRIVEMAKKIGFYEFIATKEEGLAFLINENGRNLSTGQRKKVLLLRALFADADVLILDEVLSGIDADSRPQIEVLLNQCADKILLVISHEPIDYLHFTSQYRLLDGSLHPYV